jgi:hypothetical protein
VLDKARLPATVRLTRGRDIAAACGQLAAVGDCAWFNERTRFGGDASSMPRPGTRAWSQSLPRSQPGRYLTNLDLGRAA